MTTTIEGKDLQIGDTIKVWWAPRDTIISLKPYKGLYENDPAWKGCQIADFALNRTGMAIFANNGYQLIHRPEIIQDKKITNETKQSRYEKYLELKKEFEGI